MGGPDIRLQIIVSVATQEWQAQLPKTLPKSQSLTGLLTSERSVH
jgi:hypothetical protein